jgi:hypothetical protein
MSPENQSGSLLRRLEQSLENYGVEADVRMVAAAILETARDQDWAHQPQAVIPWLSQLALELAQTSPVRKGPLRDYP